MSVSTNDLRAPSAHAPDLHAGARTLTTFPRISLAGATLAAITEHECVHIILNELEAGRGGWLVTLNLDHLRRFVYDPSFALMATHASFIVADGMPLIWASRLQGTPLPERITGSNMIWSLSAGAAERGRSVFLLGGDADTAARSANILQTRFPQLAISGVYTPPHGFEHHIAEMEKLLDAARRAQPDIIYVALGSPKQDALIQELRAVVPQAWCLGVGVSFSWVAGVLPRAPLWMQQMGLEWLHRLAHEPRRLVRRYLIDDLPFAAQLLVHAAKSRSKRTPNTTP